MNEFGIGMKFFIKEDTTPSFTKFMKDLMVKINPMEIIEITSITENGKFPYYFDNTFTNKSLRISLSADEIKQNFHSLAEWREKQIDEILND